MDVIDRLKEKFNQYKSYSEAKEWLDKNTDRVRNLFKNRTLRDFIFEPFKAVFDTPLKTIDADIYSVITQVAIINAVLAGLPGKMGVGVYVSMALEAWMAYTIARHVGVDVRKPSDVWKYFGLLAASFVVILFLFRTLARQSRFVNEYLVDMNATSAAVRAGYSCKTAKSQASRLLTFVDVKLDIQRKQKEDETRLRIDRDKVLDHLGKVIELAEAERDPRTMIEAAAEINKMMGYYK